MFSNENEKWLPNSRIVQLFAIVLLLSIISLFSIKMILVKKVHIVDKNVEIEATTMHRNVKALLKDFELSLSEHDKVSANLKDKLKDGMTIEITRAFPINIEIAGEMQKVMTTENTVGNILANMGVLLGTLDVVVPGTDEEIFENGLIRIIRIDEKLVKEKTSIPYKTVIKLDNKLKTGQEIVESEGQIGEKISTLKYTYEDEKEVVKIIEEETIITESRDRVIRKGSELLFITDQGKPYRCSSIYTMRASAYDLSFESCGKYPDHPAYGITRSGTKARPGVVAVDPKTIKLKSKLYVESLDRTQDYGFASAEDTGGAIKSNRIDLFIGNNREAFRYGMRYVKVYVLEDEIDESLIVGYGY